MSSHMIFVQSNYIICPDVLWQYWLLTQVNAWNHVALLVPLYVDEQHSDYRNDGAHPWSNFTRHEGINDSRFDIHINNNYFNWFLYGYRRYLSFDIHTYQDFSRLLRLENLSDALITHIHAIWHPCLSRRLDYIIVVDSQ